MTAVATPGDLDLDKVQGDDWEIILTWVDDSVPPVAIDMSGSTYEAQIRKTPESAVVLAEFTIDDSDAADGIITMSLDAADTADLPAICAWDFQRTITATGKVSTILSGAVRVRREVTR